MSQPAPRPDPRKLAFAKWLLLGTSLAASAAALRVGVYLAATPFPRDVRYLAGCAEGIGIDLALGLAAASPVFIPRVGAVLAAVLSVGLMLANSAGAHFHAMFLHWPTRDTLVFLKDIRVLDSSIRDHAPPHELALETIWPASASLWVMQKCASSFERVLRERFRAALALFAAVTTAVASWARTTSVSDQEYNGALGPLLHLAKTSWITYPGWDEPPPLDVLLAVQNGLATDNPGPPADSQYPFCASSLPAPPSGKTGRSALLLILESVDDRALDLVVGGVPVMPNLKRMAKDGVFFPRFFSSGNMSVYAMPPLFGGVPASPAAAILMATPLDEVLGFPGQLRREGYDTAFIYASDLSFTHQDEFVRRVGFEHIVPMPKDLPRYGWGASDGAMFDQLRAHIGRVRAAQKPYFVTAFTVSTHDPYTLPPEYRRKFSGTTAFDRLVEALAYLDDEVGRFYDWFAQNELSRGTVLAVTGDHAPRISFPGDPVDTTTGELEFRFQVPLILLGLNSEEARRARTNAENGVGGHHDVPATFAEALGVAPPRCHQGRSLLGPEVPKTRIVPSVAGDGLQFLYAHEGTRRFMLERNKGRIREYDYVTDPALRHDLAPGDAHAIEVTKFLRAFAEVMHYTVMRDKLAPPPDEEPPARLALPRATTTQRVLRGRTSGVSTGDGGVTPEIDRALVARPDWLELSVASDGRGGLVVRHWKEPSAASPGTPAIVVSDTYAQGPPLDTILPRATERAGVFVDIERPPRFRDIMATVHGTVAAVEKLPAGTRVVVESSDEVMLTSVRQFSRVDLAYRLAPRSVTERALRFAADRGFTWVSLAEDYATPEAIRAAHTAGLRVLVYPRGPSLPDDAFSVEPPDARVLD